MDAGASTVINILVDTCTLLTLCSKGDKVLEVSVSDGAVMSESLALIRDALSCGRSLTYSSFKIRCTLGDFGDRKVQKKKLLFRSIRHFARSLEEGCNQPVKY